MRKIEEATKDIVNYWIYNLSNSEIKTADDECNYLKSLLNEILEIHKAEKRPRGKWILSGGKYRCSECGEKAKHIFDKSKGGYDEYAPFRSDFCPNCGADMRKEEKDEPDTEKN